MDNDYKYRPLIYLVSRDGSSERTINNGTEGAGFTSNQPSCFSVL